MSVIHGAFPQATAAPDDPGWLARFGPDAVALIKALAQPAPGSVKAGLYDNLPAEVARDMALNAVVPIKHAARYQGYSEKHYRRRIKAGLTPPVVNRGGRKSGIRVRDLIDFASGTVAPPAAT